MRHPYSTTSLMVLLALLAMAGFWSLKTHWFESSQWHSTHGSFVSIGAWTFKVPRAWYVDKNETVADDLSRQIGLTAKSRLRRATLSGNSSTIEVWAGFHAANLYTYPQNWSQGDQSSLVRQGYALRDPIPVEVAMENAQCIMGKAPSAQQPQYIEYCVLQDAELFLIFKAARMEDLTEAIAIIRTGQFVKPNNRDRADPRGGQV